MDREDFYNMYQDDGADDGPRPQPEQLRLAGKAKIMTINGVQVSFPNMDYIEALEAKVAKLQQDLEKAQADIKSLSRDAYNTKNFVNRQVGHLNADIKEIKNKPRFEF